MNGLVISMYCQYVVKTLNIRIRQLVIDEQNCEILDDELYKSYVKLEGIINTEFFW